MIAERPDYGIRRGAASVQVVDRWLVAGITALATVLRVAYAHWNPTLYFWGPDMMHYDHAARMILFHHMFSYWGYRPDAQVTPGYPLFVSLCYGLAAHWTSDAGFWLEIVYVVQAVLSGLTAGLLYSIGRDGLPRWAAACAAVIWAVYFPAVWAVSQLLTESLFVCLLLTFTWCWVRARRRGTAAAWWWTGFVLALASLVRPVTLPVILFTLWSVWRSSGSGDTPSRRTGTDVCRQRVRKVAAHLIGYLLPLIPWWIRNIVVLHRLILSSNDAGNPLLYGTMPDMRIPPGFHPGPDQAAQAWQRIVEGFSHDPGTYLRWYTWGKLKWLFSSPWMPPVTPTTPWYEAIWLHLHLVLVLAGAVGVCAALARPSTRIWAVLAVFLTVLQLPFLPMSRYAFPVMPYLALGVGWLVVLLVGAACLRTHTARGSQAAA